MKRAFKAVMLAAMIAAGAWTSGCRAENAETVPETELSEPIIAEPVDPDAMTEGAWTSGCCAENAETVPGTEPSEPIIAEPVDPDAMTDEDFRQISDEMLIALGQQYDSLKEPAFASERPDTHGTPFTTAALSASTDKGAETLASAMFPDLPIWNITDKKAAGRWRLYEAGANRNNYILIWDPAFLDMDAQRLNVEPTEEKMLLLAAMRDIPGEKKLGAFVTDADDTLICREYYLIYSIGDYGLSDTVTLYGFAFSADKATGQLTGYASDEYDFMREVEIPDTYHPYPDE